MVQKLKEKKGFTLAELLVVVAIIGVLVAISIPIFTAQLAKARVATNQANARAAYASAAAEVIQEGGVTAKVSYTYTVKSASATKDTSAATAKITDAIDKWTKDTTLSDTDKMGDKVASAWTVVFDENGDLSGFKATA